MVDRVELTQIMSDVLAHSGGWAEVRRMGEDGTDSGGAGTGRSAQNVSWLRSVRLSEKVLSFFALSSIGSRGLCVPFSSSSRGARTRSQKKIR